MYGMVHRAARQMVLEQYGEGQWAAILATSGLGNEAFISANVYEDSVTDTLLNALAQHFETPVEAILHAFGEYWIRFAYNGDYKAMMTLAGNSLGAFLHNLNRMHDSIQVSIPGARLPTFEVVAEFPQAIDLCYISERRGLEPFVEGLLSGLMRHFGHSGQVQRVGPSGRGILFKIAISNP